MAYIQKNNPIPVTPCGRRRAGGKLSGFKLSEPDSPMKKAEPRRTIGRGKNFNKVAKNKSARGGAAGGGMTEKGVKAYRRKNPGSKLKTAVTEKNPKGKRAARRKACCGRSRSWKSERGLAARRRWRC